MITLTSSNALTVGFIRRDNSETRLKFEFVLVSNENGKFTVALKYLGDSKTIYRILEKNITDLKTAEKSFQSYYDFYSSQERKIAYPLLTEEEFRKEIA